MIVKKKDLVVGLVAIGIIFLFASLGLPTVPLQMIASGPIGEVKATGISEVGIFVGIIIVAAGIFVKLTIRGSKLNLDFYKKFQIKSIRIKK